MRWTRQRVIIGACAAVAAIGLAVALVIVLPGSATPAKPAPAGSPALLSPFTGEPVSALGPVLAVKIDNLVTAPVPPRPAGSPCGTLLGTFSPVPRGRAGARLRVTTGRRGHVQ